MTERELADILERFGINDLANEVRDAPVSIDNERNFTVWDKEREGYGVSYHISNETTDRGEPVMAVYHRLEEPEGGTKWGWGGPFYYDYPEGKDFYPEDVDQKSKENVEIEAKGNDVSGRDDDSYNAGVDQDGYDWGDEDLDEGLEISDAVAEDREYDEKIFSGDPAENVDIDDDDEWDDAIEPTGD